MGFWSSLFNPKKPEGIGLRGESAWEVTAPSDISQFFYNLPNLLPENCILYFEGTVTASEIKETFISKQSEVVAPIAKGTLWPEPESFHIPMTKENIELCVSFFNKFAIPEICHHFHVYKDETVLLEWHDAFYKDPILVSETISERNIRHFCNSLMCKYDKIKRTTEE